MIIRPSSCLLPDGTVSTGAILSTVKQHKTNAESLKKLRDYYDDKHAICKRQRTADLPNARLVHGYPRYIVTMASGYLIGNPVAYTTSAEDASQKAALEALGDAYKKMSADSVDAELAKHASIYGSGVELVFADEEATPRSATIDPQNAFVVYDDTVQRRPIFGVHYYQRVDEEGKPHDYSVKVYTASCIASYVSESMSALNEDPDEPIMAHHFGDVPLIEYWNDEDEVGDFQNVISLIDAYNTLQSDRINDKSQFVDAIMVLTGASIDDDIAYDPEKEAGGGVLGETTSTAQRIRTDRFVQLPENSTLDYLTRQMDEANAEILKEALNTDIHKMSMIPDLTDEHFAGNSSGVAMRYKLLGLEQKTKIKERWFREALKTRMRLFANFLYTRGVSAQLDIDQVQIGFTRSLPVNDVEIASMVQSLQGIVPDKLLLEQLPFVSDAEGALALLKEQKEDNLHQQNALFSRYDDPNDVGGQTNGARAGSEDI